MTFLILLILGLIIGSFLNVVIYRTPLHNEIVKRRSHCVFCNHTLSADDLVPVLSFVWLRGKCRYCKHAISARYPLVELTTALLFLASYIVFAPQGIFVWLFSLFTLVILFILFCTDLLYFRLPNAIILFASVVTLFVGIVERLGYISISFSFSNIISIPHLATAIAGYLLLALLWRISHGTLIGLGDAKLLAYIGLVFGPVHSILIMYSAVMIGGIVGIGLLLSKKVSWRTRLPFGSFIAISAIVWLFGGFPLLGYIYQHFFLLL